MFAAELKYSLNPHTQYECHFISTTHTADSWPVISPLFF